MSERPNENKRMTSITRRLHWNMIGKKIAIYLGYDLLILLLLCLGFLFTAEYLEFGTLDQDQIWSASITIDYAELENDFNQTSISEKQVENEDNSSFSKKDLLKHLYFTVTDETDIIRIRVNLYQPILIVGTIIIILLASQFLGCSLHYYAEHRKIRHLLKPINEMALKVDELSRLTLSEERYHEIENALDTIQPGENSSLSLGNEDLKGIEAAMNNLILRMRDSYRQQARFVNDASHELRTPITVIQGYVNMLSRWGKEDEKILDESIEAIKNEADHMQHLVEQLLFLARGDSGKTNLEITEFSLNEMINEVYEESLMIDENHIYKIKGLSETIMIKADLGLLKQAIRILVDNAAKYTNSGDEIVLSYGRLQDYSPFIQVQDTGIGMAEQDVMHMFERFYRSDEARNYQGTGLGLSIAKWIVDKHHGHFDILSRTDLGTRIRIILP